MAMNTDKLNRAVLAAELAALILKIAAKQLAIYALMLRAEEIGRLALGDSEN
jgi:hypothetical protein